MEFPFGSVLIGVHAYATEDERRVLETLRFLPTTLEIRRSETSGHHGNPIIVFEARTSRRKVLEEVWRRLLSRLSATELRKLVLGLHERVDDLCFLYLRFDKQAASRGQLVLTEAGDAVHIRFKIVTFPAKRDSAVEKVRTFLEGQERHEAEIQVRGH